MPSLSRGQKTKLADLGAGPVLDVTLGMQFAGAVTCDLACFGLNEAGQLADERYFIFYNQKSSPENAISVQDAGGGAQRFHIELDRLPAGVRRLVFAATIDGAGVMAELRQGSLQLSSTGQEITQFLLLGQDYQQEKALIVGEIYWKDGWRLAAVGQGFNGGLSALLKHFGGTEDTSSAAAPPAPAPAPAPAAPPPVDILKKVEAQAPQLLSLVKKATVSLQKVGLDRHRAKVALCLDISGSMMKLYQEGQVQAFAERILALASHFDDDGAIDVFLFGAQAHHPDPMTLGNFQGFVQQLRQRYPLEGGTKYGKVIEMVRQFYFPEVATRATISEEKALVPHPADLPVYVMFVTDGGTDDKPFTERQIRMASFEPIFWQFMTIGKSNFEFLEKLDSMSGRYLDNAGFFNVKAPKTVSDDVLYGLLMKEYPYWLQQAKAKGLLL